MNLVRGGSPPVIPFDCEPNYHWHHSIVGVFMADMFEVTDRPARLLGRRPSDTRRCRAAVGPPLQERASNSGAVEGRSQPGYPAGVFRVARRQSPPVLSLGNSSTTYGCFRPSDLASRLESEMPGPTGPAPVGSGCSPARSTAPSPVLRSLPSSSNSKPPSTKFARPCRAT